MSRLILILFLISSILFVSFSDQEIKEYQDFSEDLAAFDKSMEIFMKANEESANNWEKLSQGLIIDEKRVTSNLLSVIIKFQEGIMESALISDEFLDCLHPKLKTMYRDTLIGSYQMVINIIRDGDYSSEEDIEKIDKVFPRMQKSFHDFARETLNEVVKNIESVAFSPSEIDKNVHTPIKSYSRRSGGLIVFILKFVVLGTISIIITSGYLYLFYPIIDWLTPRRRNRLGGLFNTILFFLFGSPVFLLWLNCIAFIIYSANFHTSSLFWTILYSFVAVSMTMFSSARIQVIVEVREREYLVGKEDPPSIAQLIAGLTAYVIIISGILFLIFPKLIFPIFSIPINIWNNFTF